MVGPVRGEGGGLRRDVDFRSQISDGGFQDSGSFALAIRGDLRHNVYSSGTGCGVAGRGATGSGTGEGHSEWRVNRKM